MSELALQPRAAALARPTIRRIGLADIRIALTRGWDDFSANPTHVVFLCALYPAVGLLLGRAIAGGKLLPLLFPMVAGFALLGPLAALGLYEMSRRRERGLHVTWRDAFRVLRARNLDAIMVVGVALMLLFVLWLQAAEGVFAATMGAAPEAPPDAPLDFLRSVLTTRAGWAMILLGHAVGFGFALAALMLTVVSFPLLLDRTLPGGTLARAVTAVSTSIAAVLANPGTMLAWGLIVAVTLAICSVPFFIMLAVALPVLGHATWHLYRRVVGPG